MKTTHYAKVIIKDIDTIIFQGKDYDQLWLRVTEYLAAQMPIAEVLINTWTE